MTNKSTKKQPKIEEEDVYIVLNSGNDIVGDATNKIFFKNKNEITTAISEYLVTYDFSIDYKDKYKIFKLCGKANSEYTVTIDLNIEEK